MMKSVNVIGIDEYKFTKKEPPMELQLLGEHIQVIAAQGAKREGNVSIGTILSNRTKEGMVEFSINDTSTQFDISKAKEIHRMLGEAIEAAISDTLIYKFLTTKVGLDNDRASLALMDFRELRQGTRGITFPF